MRQRIRGVLTNGPLLTAVVLATTLTFHALYVLPVTRRFAQWLLQENLVVENITVVTVFTASVLALLLARRTHRDGQPAFVTWFFAVFGLGLFVVAMEEISWGQWLFFFETPGSWKAINRQGETNLHNLDGLWGRSEWMRLVFALGGLLGVLANRWRRFRPIAVPQAMLGWFVLITLYVAVDAVNDFARGSWFLSTFNPMSEWIEMLIGLSALASVVLMRDKARHCSASVAAPGESVAHQTA
ncbi:MAG: hypothetical protein ABIP21_04030 [Acidimicrobiia bacterium]